MARTLDFSNVEKRDFEPLPEGKYELTIVAVEEVNFKSGNDGLKVTYEEPESHKKIWDNLTFAENSMWKIQQFLDACGYETDGEITVEWSDLVGVTVVADVTQEEYNGKVNNRISKVYPC